MSQMVERVAKAIDDILGADHESLSLEMGTGSLTAKKLRAEAMEDAARAAIEAMREPTKAILDIKTMSTSFSNDEIWRDMIDAALKDAK
jgi:hypothetical protein